MPQKNTAEHRRRYRIPSLSPEERMRLGDEIRAFRKDILSSWLDSPEMKEFYRKYAVSKDETIEYVRYFGQEKILGYVINELICDPTKNRKHTYISTRFLSFIKEKDLGIDDLLRIIVLLKNRVIEFFFCQDPKMAMHIIDIFDMVSAGISKNYNDVIIKLLKEYTNIIDKSNMISKTDIRGTIISANNEFCRLSWFSQEELIWKPHNITRHPSMPKEVFKDLWETIRNKKIWKWIIKNRAKDGSSYWVKSTIAPILDGNNQIVEYISIRTDITELVELDLKKDEFLNIASHELRTPMTSIKGYISMVLDGDAWEINDEVRSYLTQVYKSSQRLLDLIDDMLDISKIESGKQEPVVQRMEIASLVRETAAEVRRLFAEKWQNFIISIDFESFEYNTDENRLKQVLFNLLWNANKFTPPWWTIRLVCSKTASHLVISVEDTGIGIEKSNFGKVFEKFWQVKNSLTRDASGTGLGLPIAKTIIEQMNGRMEVESEVWEGSKFSLWLPLDGTQLIK